MATRGRKKLPPGESKKAGRRATVNVTPTERALIDGYAKREGEALGPWLLKLAKRRGRRIDAGAPTIDELRARRDAIIQSICDLFAIFEAERVLEDRAAIEDAKRRPSTPAAKTDPEPT